MAILIPLSSSSTPLLFFMVQTSDHIAALTGASPTVTISKNGAAFASPSGAVTEIANGWYKVAGNATDTNTAGPLALHATAASGDPCDMVAAQVIDPATVNMGVNLINIAGAAVSTSTAQLGVNAVNHGGTAQTGRDIGASVLLSTGTGAGQLDFTSGVVKANATQWLGGTIPAVNVTGVPLVDLKYTLGTISPATAGSVRADAVTGAVGSVTGAVGSVTGAVGSVTGNVGGNVVGSVASVTARVTANTDQWNGGTVNSLISGKVDALTNIRNGTAQAGAAGTITLDAGASATDNLYRDHLVLLLSATGAGQVRPIIGYVGATKVATVTPNWATNPDATSVFALIPSAFADVVSWLDVAVSSANLQTGDAFARLGAPAGASVSADIAAVKADSAAIKTQTDKFAFTVANQVDANVIDWKSATAPAMTGDAFARLGAPVGASISADIAEIEGETDTLLAGVNVTQWAGQATAVDANNLPKVDVEAINAILLAAQALGKSTSSICWGTCSGGTLTTAVVSALNNPTSLTDAGQLIGRTIIFLGNTGTANMQAQASNITNSTTGATPTITFTAMTHAPANGDVFVVL